MEKAAEDRVTSAVMLHSNSFEGVIHFHGYSPIHNNEEAVCIFDMNGERFKVSATVTTREKCENKHALLFKLRDAVAERIANTIISKALEGVCIP